MYHQCTGNYLCKKKKEQGVLEVMVWPPQSPELNIKEAVRDYTKRQNDFRQPRPTEDLCLFQDV